MLNKEKAAYDLALIYAKTKLEYALNKNLTLDITCPKEIAETEFLLSQFKDAFDTYINEPIERFTDVTNVN